MKKTNETTKDQSPKTETVIEAAGKPEAKTKAAKVKKAPKAAKTAKVAKPDADAQPTDRLPTTLAELKQTKGGFVAYLFLSGKDRETIAKELAAAFKLADAQALKITRRITGRVRLYSRAFELVPTKK